MSNAEVFGYFRSFVVGLETTARDLRQSLDDTHSSCGKLGNGHYSNGIGREAGTVKAPQLAECEQNNLKTLCSHWNRGRMS